MVAKGEVIGAAPGSEWVKVLDHEFVEKVQLAMATPYHHPHRVGTSTFNHNGVEYFRKSQDGVYRRIK